MIDPQAVDIETVNDCMVPEYFCDVCCNYNIGPADEVGREKCVTECRSSYGSGDTNMFELTYILEVNPKVLKKYVDAQTDISNVQKFTEFIQSVKGKDDEKQLAGKKKALEKQYSLTEAQIDEIVGKIGLSVTL